MNRILEATLLMMSLKKNIQCAVEVLLLHNIRLMSQGRPDQLTDPESVTKQNPELQRVDQSQGGQCEDELNRITRQMNRRSEKGHVLLELDRKDNGQHQVMFHFRIFGLC